METYLKSFYALNNSKSKNILISLVRKDDKFTPYLQVYSNKDGVRLTLAQYLELYNSCNELFEYLDGRVPNTFLNLGTEENQLFVTGIKSVCSMIGIKQLEDNRTKCICMAKSTFERLLDLKPLIVRLLNRYEQSMPDIMETARKVKAGEILPDRFNMHGLDLHLLALELKLYSNGVTEENY
jgi:hypothetical protein